MDKENSNLHSRVLFLDYDGVVNTPKWNAEGTKCRYNFPSDNKVNNFDAVQWISEFCQKFHFAIVITSTWRFDSNYKECLVNGGLREGIDILGRTEDLWQRNPSKTRGWEIKEWLARHPEVKHYIIIDDDNNFCDDQQDKLILTDPFAGFTAGDFSRACEMFTNEKRKWKLQEVKE